MRTYSVITDTPLRLRREYFVRAESPQEAEQRVLDEGERLAVFDYEYVGKGEPTVLGTREVEGESIQ